MERNVHRALAAFAVTAMAALALAGCGGKTDNAIEAIPGADADGMDGNRERAGGLPAYEYFCTALIFSTPTGSSGYNVSAGGPVLDPELDCTVVTPVCPHTGASCSFVYGGETEFSLTNVSSPDKTVMISSDGALDLPLSQGETVTVRKSPYKVRLIRFDDEPFTKTLLRKMKI